MTTGKFQPGSEFGASNRLESAVKDLGQAIEFVNRAIIKLHEHSTGSCLHEDKIDTTTMGNGPRAFYCPRCEKDFVIVEE